MHLFGFIVENDFLNLLFLTTVIVTNFYNLLQLRTLQNKIQKNQ